MTRFYRPSWKPVCLQTRLGTKHDIKRVHLTALGGKVRNLCKKQGILRGARWVRIEKKHVRLWKNKRKIEPVKQQCHAGASLGSRLLATQARPEDVDGVAALQHELVIGVSNESKQEYLGIHWSHLGIPWKLIEVPSLSQTHCDCVFFCLYIWWLFIFLFIYI